MTDPFTQKAKRQFIEYSLMWVEFLQQKFPDDENTQDTFIFLNNVVKNSESQINEQCESWMANMKTPLNSKKTKYAKAVERITKQTAVVYHAVKYRDIDALQHSLNSPVCSKLQIFDKYRSPALTDDDKEIVWKYMDKITSSAYEASSETPPTVPSRLEIQENIKSRKEKPDEGPSMVRAFQTHINALCRLLNEAEPLVDVSDERVREEMVKWTAFAKGSTDGERNLQLCQQNNPCVIGQLVQAFPILAKIQTLERIDDKIWRNINQLNGFSTVSENIPSKMMGRIEDVANKLASDIVAGKTDMASVNLSDIGQQVLSGCDEADMSKFANNIEDLLPALQHFQT